jgi:hypothetical protein
MTKDIFVIRVDAESEKTTISVYDTKDPKAVITYECENIGEGLRWSIAFMSDVLGAKEIMNEQASKFGSMRKAADAAWEAMRDGIEIATCSCEDCRKP